MKHLEIYVDGASRGNPGPASYGVCIKKAGSEGYIEFSEYLGEATNSVAEYRALLRAMEEARKMKAEDLDIFTDSQLVARQFEGVYKVKHAGLKEIMSQVRELEKNFIRVQVRHIPRSSHPGNVRADRLCNIALNKAGK